jgi:hypothetical protein
LVDRAGHQTADNPIHPEVLASEHNLADRAIVRQHADDERRELADPLGAADICNYLTARGSEIFGHRRSHSTKAHKSNIAGGLIARDLIG